MFKRVAPVALAFFILSSCASSRPTVEAWEPTWRFLAEGIPSEATVGSADDLRVVCTDALALLRSNRAALFPTPDLAIDDAVTEWVKIAEEAFFECPPHNDQIAGFEDAYGELIRLRGEIELVLDLDR